MPALLSVPQSTKTSLLLVCAAARLLAGCGHAAESDPADDNEDVHHVEAPIDQGTPVTDAQLAARNNAVVSLSGCTGLLIGPRVVLTAAHCAQKGIDAPRPYQGSVVKVGANTSSALDTIPVGIERDYPGYWLEDGAAGNNIDVGVYILDRPSTAALPYWRPAAFAGGNVTVMGFGGTTNLNSMSCDVWADTDPYHGARFKGSNCGGASSIGGDSGGPVFDASANVVGINIGSSNTLMTIQMQVAPYVDWVNDVRREYELDLVTGQFDENDQADFVKWNGRGHESYLTSMGSPDQQAFTFCQGTIASGDFNGDGIDDLACNEPQRSRLLLNYGPAFDSEADVTIASSPCKGRLLTADFNGDTWTDLACHDGNGPTFRVKLHTGNASTPFGSGYAVNDTWCAGKIVTGRFNDDDKDDAICFMPNWGMPIRFGTPTGLGPVEPWFSTWCNAEGSTLMAGRINGDHRHDLVCWNQVANRIDVDYSDGSNTPFATSDDFVTGYAFCDYPRNRMQLADVSGDGRQDVVCYSPDYGQTWVDYNMSASRTAPHDFDGSVDYQTVAAPAY